MIKKTEKGRAIEITVRVEADADDVWRAITQPEEIKRWFPLDARGSGTDGGTVEVTWGDDAWWGMTLRTPEPGTHARFVDESTVEHGGSVLYVDYHLETVDGATVVRFVHSGFGLEEQWDEYLDGLDAGWSYFLRNLKCYLEHHAGRTRVMAWARPTVRGARAAIWSAVLGAVGSDPASVAARTPGDRLSLTLGGTPADAVVESVAPKRTLGVRLPDHHQALLFLEIEAEGEAGRVGVWLSLYEPDDDTRAAMERAVADIAASISAAGA